MYKVSKRIEVAGAHKLNLDYESKCENLHGHNWIITIHCAADQLDDNGMVVDFTHIKSSIHAELDHKYINDVLDGNINPTAENIAHWIYAKLNLDENIMPYACCYKVEVQESEGNVATYVDLGRFATTERYELMV